MFSVCVVLHVCVLLFWLLYNIGIVLHIVGVVAVVAVVSTGCCSSALCVRDLSVGVIVDGISTILATNTSQS